MADSDDISLGRGWHLNKSFSVGQIITTGAALVAIVVYMTSIEQKADQALSDVSTLRAQVTKEFSDVQERLNRSEDRTDRSFRQIIERMQRMDDKLDRLIERE